MNFFNILFTCKISEMSNIFWDTFFNVVIVCLNLRHLSNHVHIVKDKIKVRFQTSRIRTYTINTHTVSYDKFENI